MARPLPPTSSILQAYADSREAPHPAARLVVPEEFLAALKSKAHEPGCLEWSAAVRSFAISWAGGAEIPGLGRATSADEPLPYTARQLAKFCPSKAARVSATKGRSFFGGGGWKPVFPGG